MRPVQPDIPKREKKSCRALSAYWLRRGIIERKACVVCGAPGEEMHHLDYRDSTLVAWYCRKHHRQFHSHHGVGPLDWQKDIREAAARTGKARFNVELRKLMPTSQISLATTLRDLLGLARQLGGDFELDTSRFRMHLKVVP